MITTPPAPVQAKVVRAVAGSGKTYWLVNEYVELVVGRGYRPVNVPIITFTDAAGRELVDRVRSELTRIADGQRGKKTATKGESAAAQQALAELGASPIGTIHSFARRLLLQQAVDAAVPFGVEVRDTVDAALSKRMRSRIDEQIQSLRSAQPIPEGVRIRRGSNGRNYYLDQDAVALLPAVSAALLRAPEQSDIAATDAEQQLAQAWTELQSMSGPGEGVLGAADLCDIVLKIRAGFAELGQSPAKLAAEFDRRLALIDALIGELGTIDSREAGPPKAKLSRLSWATAPMRKQLAASGREDVLDRIDEVVEHSVAAKERLEQTHRSYAWVAGALALEAHLFARDSEGTDWLLQDELLQRSLRLLKNEEAARKSLQDRYPIILLDEAQDIDATQAEMLLALTQATGLIVVGDPQQSIYGFRGADYATFDRLANRLHTGEIAEHKTKTHRCVPVIVQVVNSLFADDVHHAVMGTFREKEQDSGTVTALIEPAADDQGDPVKLLAGDYLIAQADAIADQVVKFLEPGAPERLWVNVKRAGDEHAKWQPAMPADIAILVRSRTPVPSIEAALRARGVLASVRTSRDVARHPVAEGMAAALLAIARKDDTKSLLVALRSPVFACTDADLTRHVIVTGRPLSLSTHIGNRMAQRGLDPAPPSTGIEDCLDVLVEAGRALSAQGPGAALDIIAQRRAVLATLAAADGQDWLAGWKQVRQLRDAAMDRHRTVPEPTYRFAEWLVEQLAAASGTNGCVLDEPDSESVMITTMHQAKGLQWPIVVTAALNAKDNDRTPLSFDGERLAVHITNSYSTMPESEASPGDASPEVTRLMYVALTRARDHLVISGLTADSLKSPASIRPSQIGETIKSVGGELATAVQVAVYPGHEPDPAPTVLDPKREQSGGPLDVVARLAATATSAAKVLHRLTPSSVGHGEDPDAITGQLVGASSPPGSAAATGSFVHEVLATVDLASFTKLELSLDIAVGDAWARAVNLIGLDGVDQGRARELLGRARTSQVLRRAAHSAHLRRELPVCGHRSEGNEVVVTQGNIDLLFSEVAGDGSGLRWVLADYKTDSKQWTEQEFKAFYAPQLAAYEELLNAAEVPVTQKWLIRITDTAAFDVPVELTSPA